MLVWWYAGTSNIFWVYWPHVLYSGRKKNDRHTNTTHPNRNPSAGRPIIESCKQTAAQNNGATRSFLFGEATF